MTKGFYLVLGDMTTCGGRILEADPTSTLLGIPMAREGDAVTCGKFAGKFVIVGHIPLNTLNGRKYAGTLNSISSCPCGARFVASRQQRTYGV